MAEAPDFKPKKVEQPIFNTELRQKLSKPASYQDVHRESFGFKGFYRANKIYFWAIILGVGVIAVLAFFAFRPGPAPVLEEADIRLEITAPETIESGGEVVYKIKVDNRDSSSLVDLQLELTYPSGIDYLSSSPPAQNLSGSLFSVPDLVPGQNTTIFIKTRASGNINDTKELHAKLHYKYSNFSSEFVSESSNTVRLVASDVLLELQGPKTANNAQLAIYSIKYQNNSGEDINNARIRIEYPSGFEFAQASIEPDLGNNVWNVDVVPKDFEGEIQIQGSFKSTAPGESKTAKVEFLVFGDNGDFFVQSTAEFITAIGNLPLIVSQELEGQTQKSVVEPGDSLRYTIKYQNNSTVVARGINIVATIDSKAVDLGSLRAEGGQISGNTILWNEALVSKLGTLSPNESGQLSFSFRLNEPATSDSTKNLSVVTSLKIKSQEFESFFPGNELSVKVSSPASVDTALTFVSGALPPQVGRSTTYKVRLSLSNSSNDFNSVVVSAFVPLSGGGFLEDTVTTREKNSVEFDSNTGKLTWNAGSLPAYTGKFSQPRVLEFEVRVDPSQTDVYKSLTLLNNIKMTANDTFTDEEVEVSASNMTTNSLTGENAYGKGTVVP